MLKGVRCGRLKVALISRRFPLDLHRGRIESRVVVYSIETLVNMI